jgi:hypothetical protein
MPPPAAPFRLLPFDLAARDAVAAGPACALPGLAPGATPPWTGYPAAEGGSAAEPGAGEVRHRVLPPRPAA